MKIKRLGIIGDVHAADMHLEKALQLLSGARVDQIVCVGDIADGPGSLERCCRLLQSTPVLTVSGNHDSWFLDDTLRDLPFVSAPDEISDDSLRFLKSLPPTAELETIAGRLLLCHGTGTNDMHAVLPDDYGVALEYNEQLQQILAGHDYRFMICGHSHRRMVRDIQHLTIVNPGPLARVLSSDLTDGIAIADFDARTVKFYDFCDGDLVGISNPVSLTNG